MLETVERYNQAFLAGDVETIQDMLTSRCLDSLGQDLVRRVVEEAPEANPDLASVKVTVDLIADDTARVTSRFNDPQFDVERERWNVEDGEWRNDDCT